MKKTISFLVGLGFLVLTCAPASAAWFDKAKTPATQGKPVSQASELVTKQKADLNGKEWTIELRASGASVKSRAESDVISFAEEKVASKNLSALGYASTNFSIRNEDDGTIIWETMQTSEKAGTAFWRGDIGPDGIMRGVLSKRDVKGNIKDYNFVSVAK